MKNFSWFLFLLMPLTVYSQEKSVITFEVAPDTYKNEYFDLSIKKPNQWYYQSPEDTMKMGQMGSKMLAGDDKKMEAIFKESLKSSLILFSFFEHPPGAPVNTNPNVVGVAENVSLAPGIKKGCDYLFHVKNILIQSNANYTIQEDCQTEIVVGSHFGKMIMSTMMLGTEVFQNYSACIKGDHAIVIIQTFFDDESKLLTDKLISTLQVSCQ